MTYKTTQQIVIKPSKNTCNKTAQQNKRKRVKISRRQNCKRLPNCTRGLSCTRTKLHEDTFARVTFLQESKKKNRKKIKKRLKDKLIKKQK